jgi:hypothetical protein
MTAEVKNPDRFYDYFVDAVEDITLPPSISSKDHLQNYGYMQQQHEQIRKTDSQLNLFESFLKFGNRMNGVESSDSLLSAVSSSGIMNSSSQPSFAEQNISLRNIYSAVNFLTVPPNESSTSLSSELTPGSPRVYSEAEQIQEGHALYPIYLMFTMIDSFLLNKEAEERV